MSKQQPEITMETLHKDIVDVDRSVGELREEIQELKKLIETLKDELALSEQEREQG